MPSPEPKSEEHIVTQDAMPQGSLLPTSRDDAVQSLSAAPKKQAVVVYEGEEGWQPPKVVHAGQQHSDFEQDDDTGSGEADDTPESRDLLAEYPDDTEEIELLHSRISSVKALRLPRFAKHLKSLCLRQNAITELDPEEFGPLTQLELLDVYDNQIKELGMTLKDMVNLKSLDLSFNLLRSIPEVIECLTNLEIVYFVQNKFTKIDGLDNVGHSLRSLELGGNRIRTIENLDALVNLEELWLGKNKITKLENLGTLKKLKILSMQSNRVTKLEHLEGLESLEQLYLSHNGVLRIEGLEKNFKLKTLDLGNNEISALENLSHLKELQELWTNDNRIPDLRALERELGKTTTLETIYLEGNPCQRSDQGGYRRKVILALPQVTQVDATYVKPL